MSGGESECRVALAVTRLNLDLSTREFIKKTNEVMQQLSPHVSAMILSPPIMPLYEALTGRRRYGSYRSNLKTLITRLLGISRRRRMTLVLTPILRRAGNKLYLGNVLLPSMGPPIFKGKNVIPVSERVSGSSNLEMITIDNVSICFAILNDLDVPEVIRAYTYLGSDAVVAVSPPIISRRKPTMTLMVAATRAKENRIPVIGLGGYAEGGSIQQPTFIVRKDGVIAEVAEGAEPDIFEVEIPSSGRRPKPDLARKYIKLIREHLVKDDEVVKHMML